MTDETKPDAPERIYLQVPDDCDGYADAAKGEVTWCADPINDHDVEYIRADAARAMIVGELRAEADRLDSIPREFNGDQGWLARMVEANGLRNAAIRLETTQPPRQPSVSPGGPAEREGE